MKYIFIAFSFACLFTACKESSISVLRPLSQTLGDSDEVITLDDSVPFLHLVQGKETVIDVPTPELQTVDSIVQAYRYVALETNKDCLIRKIDKVCADSSYIFVYDHDNSSVLRFNTEGKFLGKIGSAGKGPKEYLEVWSMALNKDRKEICLVDLRGRKLLYFDYEGRYLKEDPMFYLFPELEFLKNKRVIYSGFAHNKNAPQIDFFRLLISDTNQNPLFRGFQITPELRDRFSMEGSKPLMKFDEEVYFSQLLSDTIWAIKDTLCEAKFVLNFPDRPSLFSAHDLSQMTDELFIKKTKGKTTFLGDYLVTKDLFYAGLANENGEGVPLFYSRKSGLVRYGFLYPPYITTRLGDYLFKWANFVFTNGDLVMVLQPSQMLATAHSLDKKNYNRLAQQDRTLVEKLDVEDNPVLMIVTLKKF